LRSHRLTCRWQPLPASPAKPPINVPALNTMGNAPSDSPVRWRTGPCGCNRDTTSRRVPTCRRTARGPHTSHGAGGRSRRARVCWRFLWEDDRDLTGIAAHDVAPCAASHRRWIRSSRARAAYAPPGRADRTGTAHPAGSRTGRTRRQRPVSDNRRCSWRRHNGCTSSFSFGCSS